MAIVRLPAAARIKRASWTLDRPAQINRSDWTKRRQVVQQPGPSLWSAKLELVTAIGEDSVRPTRAFLAKLQGAINTFYLPATENQQTAAALPGLNGLGAITGSAGMTISADLRTATRTGGAGAWNEAIRSTSATLYSAGTVSFRAATATNNIMLGLNVDPLTDNGYGSLDYALFCSGDGTLHPWIAGADQGGYGRYTPDDLLSVVYLAPFVRFYRNGELLLSTAAAPNLSLYLDSSFGEIGATARDVTFAGGNAATAGFTLVGLTPNSPSALKEGWLATALLHGGGAQLVVVTQDMASDGAGAGTPLFEPPLRAPPFAFVTGRPFAQVALAGSEVGWGVEPGQLYAISMDVEEVI